MLPSLESTSTSTGAASATGRPIATGRVDEVGRIAVVRPNGIGDFVFALPALTALRATYRDAEIVYLGRPWHAEFLAGRPGPVDRVTVVPPEVLSADVGESDAADLTAGLAEEGFDLALQMYGGGRHSNPFTAALGARVTAGLRDVGARPLDRWVPYVYYQHEVFRLLEVAGLVGAALTALDARLTVTDDDRAEVEQAVPPTDAPIAVVNPGAGDPRRRWPPEKFAAVAAALCGAGATVAVSGNVDDRPLAAAITRRVDGLVDLTGRLSVSGLAGLLERAAVVVSNDSGPLHLAAAVGSATVGIYWCGNLVNAGPFWRTRHRPVLSWRLRCPVCGIDNTAARCPHDASFVADVPTGEVTAHALDLLSGGAERRYRATGRG